MGLKITAWFGGVSRRMVAVVVIVLVLCSSVGAALVAVHVRLSDIEDHIAHRAESERDTGRATTADEDDIATDVFEAAVTGVEEVLERRNTASTEDFLERLTNPQNEAYIADEALGLYRRVDGHLRVSLWSGDRRFFRLEAHAVRGTVEIESQLGEQITVSDTENDRSSARAFFEEEAARMADVLETESRMREELERLSGRAPVASILERDNLRVTRIVRDGFVLRRGFVNEGGAVITRVSLHAEEDEYRVDGRVTEGGLREFSGAVADALRAYDPAQEMEAVLTELEERADTIVSDQGFAEYLEERGLEARVSPSDDADLEDTDWPREYYRLVDIETREPLAYITVDALDGTLELVDVDAEVSSVLDRVAATHGLGGAVDTGTDNPGFLLLGLKDNLPDSIMYVRPGAEEISIISIPRDIYEDGQKLNEVYSVYGPDPMIDRIERRLGLEIDHYIAIDMYAFSDVVDVLGRVPVDIEREFLDPTKHYSVDGERRMLYFPPGEHELNSDAALSFARSRATSSDFDRARRQQIILSGIRERVDQLALRDVDTIVQLIRVGLEHSDTDIGFLDTLQYYRRYRDVEGTRRLVLSTSNVFYSTYSGLYEDGRDPGESEDDTEDRGAWILRPRAENWDSVQQFVRDWLSGGQPEADDYFDRPSEEPAGGVDIDAVQELNLPRSEG
ncbi:MAG: LCP family protein [Spirochaetaceae bacterium]